MKTDPSPKAWFRYPIMWLVIAPPLGSVIAAPVNQHSGRNPIGATFGPEIGGGYRTRG